MSTSVLQVRDVPENVLARLRERAAALGISLSAYVRALLTYDADHPTIAEAIARMTSRTPVAVTNEEIISAIHEGRR